MNAVFPLYMAAVLFSCFVAGALVGALLARTRPDEPMLDATLTAWMNKLRSFLSSSRGTPTS